MRKTEGRAAPPGNQVSETYNRPLFSETQEETGNFLSNFQLCPVVMLPSLCKLIRLRKQLFFKAQDIVVGGLAASKC